MKTRKQMILDCISDSIQKLWYYDRKEDEDLPVGAIEEALEAGEITIDEMVQHFREILEED